MRLKTKVIIVTGGNSGIGLETAKGLCELGHDVVISVRDDAKGAAAISEIKAEVPTAKVSYLTMELSDPASIREFVNKFTMTGKKLNVLLNNAGMFKEITGTERFWVNGNSEKEITMTVNCIGPFLLTNLLLDALKSTGTEEEPSRIVNVSSLLTTQGPRYDNRGQFFIDDLMLNEEGHYVNGFQAYRNSKMAMNLWANEMAVKLEGTNVHINSVCPGFIPSTNLARDTTATCGMSMLYTLLDTCCGRLLVGTQPVSEGKRRLMKMCLDAETKNINGVLYVHDEVTQETPIVLDPAHKSAIWGLCVQYSGLE